MRLPGFGVGPLVLLIVFDCEQDRREAANTERRTERLVECEKRSRLRSTINIKGGSLLQIRCL